MSLRPTYATQESIHQPLDAMQALVARGLVWSDGGEPCTLYRFGGNSSSSAIPFAIPEIDHALPHQGLQRGALHEFFYNDPLMPKAFPSSIPALLAQSALRTAAAQENAWRASGSLFTIAWIGRSAWPTPYSISQIASSAELSSDALIKASLFIDPPNDKLTLWAIETALRSLAVNLVVAQCPRISLTTTKRLSLAAQNNGTTALLLRNIRDSGAPSCAATKWMVTPTPSSHETPLWDLSLLKIKGNALQSTSWLVGIDGTTSNVSMRVFPRVVDRSHEENDTLKRYGT
jgi:protein ImuA